jgi:hypothetical protein
MLLIDVKDAPESSLPAPSILYGVPLILCSYILPNCEIREICEIGQSGKTFFTPFLISPFSLFSPISR